MHWLTAAILLVSGTFILASLPDIVYRDSDGHLRCRYRRQEDRFRNQSWSEEEETAFWGRSNQIIERLGKSGSFGGTYFENEKRSYPAAMFAFLAGHRDAALKFLQSEDAQAGDNAHTEGIDYYPCFTLKGQVRKYFYFGQYLDLPYRKRMLDGAKKWTDKDPKGRPHPKYGRGKGGGGWGPDVRGGWVDGRNTDNLRAMREVAVYLMAEEAGNEKTRLLYKEKITRYVRALYHIGMGEWDSENYHGHTLAAYLNLHDFARDPEVKLLGKAACDWLCAAGALKYLRGGFGGPTKRDYGGGNVVYGAGASHALALYFGDAPYPDPDPEPDAVHQITSPYRPAHALVGLARKEFERPVEIFSTKPVYENWKSGGEDQPQFWETLFFGNSYYLGSVVSADAAGDVGPFKLLATNSKRGVDYFVAHGGDRWDRPGKYEGDQIGQYRNLLLWVRPGDDRPFTFQVPRSAGMETGGDVWYIRLEKTWLALWPIGLESPQELDISKSKRREDYKDERLLHCEVKKDGYVGFALEVGEMSVQKSFGAFQKAVEAESRLDISGIDSGRVILTGSYGSTLELVHNSESDLPRVIRNGELRDWGACFDLYHPVGRKGPISLGWKEGTLRVEAGGWVFTQTVDAKGRVKFQESAE